MKREILLKSFFLILAGLMLWTATRTSFAQFNSSHALEFLASEEFKVTEVFLKADDGRPSGPCPVRVTFRGYITANGPGRIKYTFTRSDRATGPIHTMEFKKAGTQAVVTDWTLGDRRVLPRYAGWQAVKVLSPVEIESSHDTGAFEINCGGTADTQTNPNQPGPAPDRRKIRTWLSTAPITLKQNETTRFELMNTGKEPVRVRLQFVNKNGEVISAQDVTINPKGPHVPEVSIAPLCCDEIRVQVGATSLLLIRPTLRIVDKNSGDTIRVIEPNGFTKTALGPPVSQP